MLNTRASVYIELALSFMTLLLVLVVSYMCIQVYHVNKPGDSEINELSSYATVAKPTNIWQND
jgi:hypothetical protein